MVTVGGGVMDKVVVNVASWTRGGVGFLGCGSCRGIVACVIAGGGGEGAS